MKLMWLFLLLLVPILGTGCQDQDPSSSKGEYDYTSRKAIIPGPQEAGHDQELAQLARRYDRSFHALSALPSGVNVSFLELLPEKAKERALFESFLRETDSWDFEEYAGMSVRDTGAVWSRVAGAYAGPGIAADAWRYALLRDFGGSAEKIEHARELLLRALDGLHRAVEITGVQGVIARGYMRIDFSPYRVPEPVPLADEQGRPLPLEKDNHSWREDFSGRYPDYLWEDSCSRDMYIGWVIGFAGAWEVIRDDPTIPDKIKQELKTDALDLARELAKKRMQENGKEYDLLIPDADGRLTYHSYLNENWLDRTLVGLPRNGFHAIMALGCVAGLAYVAEDPDIDAFLYDELIDRRGLPAIAQEHVNWIYAGEYSNFSNYNMAFEGAYLALRYLRPQAKKARKEVQEALEQGLYNIPGEERQPIEMGQTFFDLTYAAGMAGGSVWAPPDKEVDQDVIDRGLKTLKQFPTPPYWNTPIRNCDEQETASKSCTAVDGTHLDLLGPVGWKGELVAKQILHKKIRPPSDFDWRSNPYTVNTKPEDSDTGMMPGVDFRFAYWLGRWLRR